MTASYGGCECSKRLILCHILPFTFVVYLVPGMFGAPLKALAGYLPPMSYLWISILSKRGNIGFKAGDSNAENLCEKPKFSDFLHFPHGIKGYFDYESGNCLRKESKTSPYLCRFHRTWLCELQRNGSHGFGLILKCSKSLNNDYIMLALYVDDKKELPESDWYTSQL